MKSIQQLTDRELQEWIYSSNLQQEKHLKWISNVVSVFVALTIAGLVFYAIVMFLALNR